MTTVASSMMGQYTMLFCPPSPTAGLPAPNLAYRRAGNFHVKK